MGGDGLLGFWRRRHRVHEGMISHEREGDVFAAVDLGSNSFHMIVARFEHGQLQVIDRLREMVRVAGGLNDDGDLAKGARNRAIACLARFGQRIGGMPPDHVRVVATNTFRRARNPRAFLVAAEAALGHAIEVISGHEEARLIYLGVAQGLAMRERKRLVVDIGGGSTELIIGQGYEAEQLESLSVGCVGVSKRFFADGVVTRAQFKAAQTAVALELRPFRTFLRAAGWEEVVGSSGTVRAARQVIQEAGWGDRGITERGLKKIRRVLEDAGKMRRVDLSGLSEERRPVFPGGVAILLACFRNLQITEMRVSDPALREGVLHDLIGRTRHEDPREASVEALATRYRVDEEQGQRVGATVLAAFDQVAGVWDLAPTHRMLLGWAARLHEIGLAISHSDYNRHGAYLLEHSELNGFSRGEQLMLATLVSGHRRKFTRELFAALPARLVETAIRICALLRLAVLLHRSRVPEAIPPIEWRVRDDTVSLAIAEPWLADHPLTEADLLDEQTHLSRVGLLLDFGERLAVGGG